MWDVRGMPGRGQDHEDSGVGGPPGDEKGKHRRHLHTGLRRDLNHYIRPQRFYKEVVSWGTLSHPNVLRLVGAQEDMRKRQFVTVSEWMVHGSIMEYIEIHHSNRLELVRDLATPAAPLAQQDNSCTGRPRAWSTSIVSLLHMGISKGSVFLRR